MHMVILVCMCVLAGVHKLQEKSSDFVLFLHIKNYISNHNSDNDGFEYAVRVLICLKQCNKMNSICLTTVLTNNAKV